MKTDYNLIKCPKCGVGSEKLYQKNGDSAFGRKFAVPYFKEKYRCHNCNYSFEVELTFQYKNIQKIPEDELSNG